MPLVTKQYIGVTIANSFGDNASVQPIAPLNPTRKSLRIQVTGANPGLLQFANKVRNDGSDFTIAAGQFMTWEQSDTCPLEAINIGSVAATTWAILEGYQK